MDTTRKPAHTMTAGDLMTCIPVIIPRQMLMREAFRLIQQAGAGEAPVVDERGRCLGVLSPADTYRWVAAGTPPTAVGPIPTCPYQVRGRLPNGDEAVICTLADGSCPFQAVQPTTAGRHSDLCLREEAEPPPFGTLSCYVTTGVATVKSEITLPELVRKISDARADRLVVVDDSEHPIGTVSATAVLTAIADCEGCNSGLGDTVVPRTPISVGN